MPLQYKLTEDGSAIQMDDAGLPIVDDVDDKGTILETTAINAIHLLDKVKNVQSEIVTKNGKIKDQAKLMKLLEDSGVEVTAESLTEFLSTAKTAIQTTKDLEKGDLKKASEVETIRQDAEKKVKDELKNITTEYQTKVENLEGIVEKQSGTIFQLRVADKFNTSEFVTKKIARSISEVRKLFMGQFKIETDEETGKEVVVAYYEGGARDGEKVYSQDRIGELADFEESMKILVNYSPDRVSLLGGVDASGGGAGGSGGAGGAGGGLDLRNNPWIRGENYNLSDQKTILEKNPKTAERMKAQAKVQNSQGAAA